MVIAIGKEQVPPASASTTKSVEVSVSKAKLKTLLTVVNTTKEPVRKAKVKASRTSAPKSLKARGVWLKSLLYEAGFRGAELKTAWAVAMKESRGNPTSHNTNASTGDNSYGIFQINMIGSLGADRREKFGISSNNALFDPLTNAKIAHYMSNHGTDWSSWDIDSSGYNGGVSAKAYRYWLTQYPKG